MFTQNVQFGYVKGWGIDVKMCTKMGLEERGIEDVSCVQLA
jgi:hypothetical protein